MSNTNKRKYDQVDGNDREVESSREQHILQRYSRQMLLPEIGLSGQQALLNRKVLVIGAGGIGSTAILYLAAAGVSLGVVDFDTVDVSNLHRQVLHSNSTAGMKKVDSAAQRVRDLNPLCDITTLPEMLTAVNALELVKEYDVIVDASDNFTARYIINDACVLLNKPLVSGSAVGLEGQITVIIPHVTACYRCLYPEPNTACRSCSDAGVLGPVPGLIGCLEAIEAMKLIMSPTAAIATMTGIVGTAEAAGTVAVGETATEDLASKSSLQPLLGRQTFYDAASGSFRTFKLPGRSSDCAICGSNPSISSLQDTEAFLLRAQGLSNTTADITSTAVPTTTTPADATSTTAALIDDTKVGALNEISVTDFYRFIHGSAVAVDSNDTIAHPLLLRLVVDVRSSTQFEMASLRHYSAVMAFATIDACLSSLQQYQGNKDVTYNTVVVSVPLSELEGGNTASGQELRQQVVLDKVRKLRRFITNWNRTKNKEKHSSLSNTRKQQQHDSDDDLFVLCRRGISSVQAAHLLVRFGFGPNVVNITGGLTAWKDIDPMFPMY